MRTDEHVMAVHHASGECASPPVRLFADPDRRGNNQGRVLTAIDASSAEWLIGKRYASYLPWLLYTTFTPPHHCLLKLAAPYAFARSAASAGAAVADYFITLTFLPPLLLPPAYH